MRGEIFTNPVTEMSSFEPLAGEALPGFDWALWVGYKPGVKDNEGATAIEAMADALGRALGGDEAVFSSRLYLLQAPKLSQEGAEAICRELLGQRPDPDLAGDPSGGVGPGSGHRGGDPPGGAGPHPHGQELGHRQRRGAAGALGPAGPVFKPGRRAGDPGLLQRPRGAGPAPDRGPGRPHRRGAGVREPGPLRPLQPQHLWRPLFLPGPGQRREEGGGQPVQGDHQGAPPRSWPRPRTGW